MLANEEMAAGGAEFGRLLAGFRLSFGLSQDELARRSGMSVRAIRDLERGQVDRPRQTTVALLADALRLNETDREAFEKAASGALGRAEGRTGAPETPQRAVPASCHRILPTSPGANSPWSGCTAECGANTSPLRW